MGGWQGWGRYKHECGYKGHWMEEALENPRGEALSVGGSTKGDTQEWSQPSAPTISTQATERSIVVVGSEIGNEAKSHHLDKATMHQEGGKTKARKRALDLLS